MNINYLYIAILALFIWLTVRGYRRGFLRLTVSFVGMIVIIVCAKSATPYISSYLINNTDTYETIRDKVTERFAEANAAYDNTIPANQNITINTYDIPDVLKDNLISNNTEQMYKSLLVNVFEEYVSAYLAKTAIKALTFVVTFVLLILAFRVLLKLVDIISRIPIIKGINKIAGGVLGFLEALIAVWIFFFLIVVFIGNDSGSLLLKMIADNEILSFLFNSNILINVIS